MMTNPDRQLMLQRELPFSRDLVWKAMTDANHVGRWWGPDGFTTENSTMDFRVEGQWKYEMVGPDGTRYPNLITFKEIVVPSRIVFDQGDRDRVWFETTITLEATLRGTLVTIVQTYPTQATRDEVVEKYNAIEGGKQHVAKLEAYIAANLV
jgi:uncharacterized protein YndB with AHSA1/START domain